MNVSDNSESMVQVSAKFYESKQQDGDMTLGNLHFFEETPNGRAEQIISIAKTPSILNSTSSAIEKKSHEKE